MLLLGLRASDSSFSMVYGRQPRFWRAWMAQWSHQCAGHIWPSQGGGGLASSACGLSLHW